jgi:hypothetical protein
MDFSYLLTPLVYTDGGFKKVKINANKWLTFAQDGIY